MEINVLFAEGLEVCFDAGWLEAIAGQALAAEGLGDDTEVGLVITTEQQVQELNRTYRGKDAPTDVLAFALLPEQDSPFAAPPDGIKHLGEVVISYPQAVGQAAEHGHSVKREVAILAIHGVLHLLGYDHIEDDEAAVMSAREAEILKMVEAGLQ